MQPNYGYLSVLPIIVAIGFALWKRQVLLALLLGIAVGATIIDHWNPLLGVLHSVSTYVVGKGLADKDNAGIVIFALLIGGMLSIVRGIGGAQAIANFVRGKALTVRSTQMAATLMGIVMFFDDYASCITVGSAMKSAARRQRVSSEKLSYILDATAAPVSTIAPLSTWVAMEVGLVAAALESIHSTAKPFTFYCLSLPFQFYSIVAITFLIACVVLNRDFGPMFAAEHRARTKGEYVRTGGTPLASSDQTFAALTKTPNVYAFLVPVFSFLFVTVMALWYTGYEPGRSISECLANSSPVVALMWSVVVATIIALGFAIIDSRLDLDHCMTMWFEGIKEMLLAAAILTLTFALKALLKDMQLASWLASASTHVLAGIWVPCITFVLACIISFATGTSWGTNALLMPIAVPVVAAMAPGNQTLVMVTIGSVFTGAVFGDHCSPISDTTILSSVSAAADHVDHVRTQLPYAIVSAVISLVFGFLPASLGMPLWAVIPICIVATVFVVRILGKKLPPPIESEAEVGARIETSYPIRAVATLD